MLLGYISYKRYVFIITKLINILLSTNNFVILQNLIKGLTGFDSRHWREVSMPSIVEVARKYQSSSHINGNDYNYALAA